MKYILRLILFNFLNPACEWKITLCHIKTTNNLPEFSPQSFLDPYFGIFSWIWHLWWILAVKGNKMKVFFNSDHTLLYPRPYVTLFLFISSSLKLHSRYIYFSLQFHSIDRCLGLQIIQGVLLIFNFEILNNSANF